jgi:hypothetical protein
MSALTRFFRAIWWIFSRLWAPLMALGWPALIVYGAISPRAGDVDAIRESGGEVPLLIGVAGGSSDCRNSNPCASSAAHRSYLAFPSALSSAAVTIVEDAPQGVVVSVERGAAIFVLGIWLICIFGTWFYWIRPRVMSSNTSLERTREG